MEGEGLRKSAQAMVWAGGVSALALLIAGTAGPALAQDQTQAAPDAQAPIATQPQAPADASANPPPAAEPAAAAPPPADTSAPATPAAATPDSGAALPVQDVNAPPPPAPTLTVAPPPAPVQAQALSPLDLFSTGRDTGLGQDVWKGSSADIARAVIPGLAARPLSPAGVALAARILAQAATAPDGAGSDADLAAARARALLAMGEAKLAETILDHTPGLADNALLSETAAEAALIQSEDAKACAIGDALGPGRDGLYWLKLRAYCQALAGKTGEAQLTLALANPQARDPIYARLMGAVVNNTPPGAASVRNGLDLALSRHLNLDLSHAAADAPAAIAPALQATPAAAPPLLSESDVLGALHAARTYPAFVAAAKSIQPGLAALVQAKTPLTDPVAEAAAALAAGDLADAQAIRAGLTGDAVPGAGPGDLPILDAALAAAAGKPDAPTLDKLSELAAAEARQPRPASPRLAAPHPRTQAAAVIFAALGPDASGADRAELFGLDLPRAEAPPARLLALQVAARRKLQGETALIALSVAQAGGAAGPGPYDRAAIIDALSQAGLGADAQAFAVEGLVSLLIR